MHAEQSSCWLSYRNVNLLLIFIIILCCWYLTNFKPWSLSIVAENNRKPKAYQPPYWSQKLKVFNQVIIAHLISKARFYDNEHIKYNAPQWAEHITTKCFHAVHIYLEILRKYHEMVLFREQWHVFWNFNLARKLKCHVAIMLTILICIA